MRHRCLSEGRWPEKQEEWGAGLGREGDTGAEVGVGLDVLEWRWAICPSVHPSPTRGQAFFWALGIQQGRDRQTPCLCGGTGNKHESKQTLERTAGTQGGGAG